jgi:thiol:disulfide interchange protein
MMAFTLLGALIYLLAESGRRESFTRLCVAMGFGIGYWAMFVTVGAEQFGTNLRAPLRRLYPTWCEAC